MNSLHKPVRLVDIAERVGVSKGAVATVLNGRNTLRISAATSARILAAARELNYEPNLAARMLAGKSSMCIGVLIDSHAPPLIYRMLCELERAVASCSYRIMIGHAHNDMEHFFACYQDFIKHGVDAIACFGHEYPGQEKKVKEFFIGAKKLFFLNAPCFAPASYLDVQIETGIFAAMSHLVGLGLRRIGIMTTPYRNSSTLKREQGFFQGLERFDLSPEQCCVTAIGNTSSHAEMSSQIEEYLHKEVKHRNLQAVIARNDIYALELIRQATLMGLKVPEDLAVIGVDNEPFSSSCHPSLTTIDQKPKEVGKAMSEMLLQAIKEDSKEPKIKRIETELIIRESCAKCPA